MVLVVASKKSIYEGRKEGSLFVTIEIFQTMVPLVALLVLLESLPWMS